MARVSWKNISGQWYGAAGRPPSPEDHDLLLRPFRPGSGHWDLHLPGARVFTSDFLKPLSTAKKVAESFLENRGDYRRVTLPQTATDAAETWWVHKNRTEILRGARNQARHRRLENKNAAKSKLRQCVRRDR